MSEDGVSRKGGFVTSADVARHAGVSRSAVSRTFTPGASVSAAVREKVTKAAEELGYSVNRLARGLHANRSDLIAIVASNLAEPFIASQLDALSAALMERGQPTLLLNAGARDMSALMTLVLEYRVRAVIVLSGAPPTEIVEQCLKGRQRMILVNREAQGATVDIVRTQDIAGSRLAAEHLMSGGRRRLAVIRSGSETPTRLRRAAGFCDRLAEAGLTALEWAQGREDYDAGAMAARALLGPDGVAPDLEAAFCVTDRTALGFLNSARHELGVSVPDRLAVVGFDGIAEAAWASHGLSTVAQSIPDFVAAVVSILDTPRGEDARGQERLVPVELLRRGSS
jgi:DNA-binding LacI/PurR family transcriptional regulator